jgi:hypothetical protein
MATIQKPNTFSLPKNDKDEMARQCSFGDERARHSPSWKGRSTQIDLVRRLKAYELEDAAYTDKSDAIRTILENHES